MTALQSSKMGRILVLVALKEIGIETNALSPELLTREIAQRADRIVTMVAPGPAF